MGVLPGNFWAASETACLAKGVSGLLTTMIPRMQSGVPSGGLMSRFASVSTGFTPVFPLSSQKYTIIRSSDMGFLQYNTKLGCSRFPLTSSDWKISFNSVKVCSRSFFCTVYPRSRNICSVVRLARKKFRTSSSRSMAAWEAL
eukprot:CAMPEP_0204477002 /NCGR_PEP_ID=MMETSP0471-20130131/30511_1 /ASSEMBLY_ACC=CAM_ASM_000602 /TAXON_ID=2969 /ORGANISM="Oxyrrhis marina" /LENGTH=142 /DNA_ID=CAMNT_0051479665 /DNA_START=321 /DNA_END=749 /DNA_ORIENTATION=+